MRLNFSEVLSLYWMKMPWDRQRVKQVFMVNIWKLLNVPFRLTPALYSEFTPDRFGGPYGMLEMESR